MKDFIAICIAILASRCLIGLRGIGKHYSKYQNVTFCWECTTVLNPGILSTFIPPLASLLHSVPLPEFFESNKGHYEHGGVLELWWKGLMVILGHPLHYSSPHVSSLSIKQNSCWISMAPSAVILHTSNIGLIQYSFQCWLLRQYGWHTQRSSWSIGLFVNFESGWDKCQRSWYTDCQELRQCNQHK